ncbi:hypothetical protein GF380_01190 [Candidatus Uhrbacteria bacterium]|nr:hypothetical protein [Candidatus Uhrbacteria bacterium]
MGTPQQQGQLVPLYFDAVVSQFDGVTSPPLSVTPTVKQVIKAISTDVRLKNDIEECREYLRTDIENNKRGAKGALETPEYSEAKRSLLGVTWSGTFEKRGNSSLSTFSGFLSFDIDYDKTQKVIDYESERQKTLAIYKRLKTDPFVALLFGSVSGIGVKGLVKIPAVTSDAEYKAYFRAWQAYVKTTYAIELDSLPDISRLCFLSYQQSPHINEDSKVFTEKISSEKTVAPMQKIDSQTDASVKAALLVLKRYGIQEQIDRNSFVGLCAACKRGGVSYSDFNAIMQKSPGYNAKENFRIWNTAHPDARDSAMTVSTLISYARKADKKLYLEIRNSNRKQEEGDDSQGGLATAIEKKLLKRYLFRLNTVTDKIFVQANNEERMMSDYVEAEMRCWLLDQGFSRRDAVTDVIRKIAFQNQFNPIHEYFQRLKWNGQDHLHALCQHFTDPDNIFHEVFYAWLLGVIRRVFTGQHHQALIFVGKQGKGKSYFARWLCPLQQFHIEAPIRPDTNDDKIRMTENLIWEISELGATTRRSDVEALKHFISQEYAVFRRAHDKYDQRKPAIASYIGTVNHDGAGFLNDPTGHRRWWPIEITNIDWGYTDIDVHQIWAQAYTCYLEDPTDGEISEATQKIINENIENEFSVTDPVENLLIRTLEFSGHAEDFLDTTEILVILEKAGYRRGTQRGDEMFVSKAMKRLSESGFPVTKGKKNGRTGPRGYLGVRGIDTKW